MCTMSIHADEAFVMALRSYAAKIGKSVNRTVQELLSPMLGLATAEREVVNPYLAVCGVLPKGEASALKKSVAAQRKIDAKLWK